MAPIRQLPPNVVNKIAAGEVIERPASVVKELVENAVDAGATRIDVTLEQGGGELVRVVDDGCGIPADQLPLALAAHATSKIADADDLFQVATLGFRGEALASIASVSRLTLRSRPADADAGAELAVAGGQSEEMAPCGCPIGTSIEVGNLFFNTPVRRKFLRTTQTEMGHSSEALTRIALAHPQIHFTLKHHDRLVQELPPVAGWRDRIAALFGDEIAMSLIGVGSDDGPVQLSGFVAHPDHSRANNRMQYLLLNGRHIRDRSLQHALGEAYRGLLLTGRYPIAFLQLAMPPEMVDVNVHPSKLEVRFQESGRIYSQLLGTLRTKFLTTDLTTRPQSAAEATTHSAHDAAHTDELRREFVSWAKGQLGDGPAAPAAAEESRAWEQANLDLQFAHEGEAGLSLNRLDRNWPPAEDRAGANVHRHDQAAGVPPLQAPPARGHTPDGTPALQVHNRYLITENDEGVVVIDQHALHERILYEQLREKVLGGSLETQQLLVPETVSLTSAEAAAVLEAADLLSQLGIDVEPFGGDTVLVSSYPAMLANLQPAEILRQMVEHLVNGEKARDRRDLLDELLHMISCKAAIKAGDRLSAEEIGALLEQRRLVKDSHHCPHGRPTSLVFTRDELDRRFMRI